MSTDVASTRRETATLVGDSALFTAIAVVLGPLAVVAGPGAAWLFHGRRIDKTAAISWLLGAVVSFIAVGAIYFMLVALMTAVGPIGGSEFALPIIVLAVAGIVFVSALIALDVDALRDLGPERRAHTRLDVARLIVTAVFAVALVAITLVQRANPASEVGDAGVFALMAGAMGAITMWVGTMIHARLEKSAGSAEASSGIGAQE